MITFCFLSLCLPFLSFYHFSLSYRLPNISRFIMHIKITDYITFRRGGIGSVSHSKFKTFKKQIFTKCSNVLFSWDRDRFLVWENFPMVNDLTVPVLPDETPFGVMAWWWFLAWTPDEGIQFRSQSWDEFIYIICPACWASQQVTNIRAGMVSIWQHPLMFILHAANRSILSSYRKENTTLLWLQFWF